MGLINQLNSYTGITINEDLGIKAKTNYDMNYDLTILTVYRGTDRIDRELDSTITTQHGSHILRSLINQTARQLEDQYYKEHYTQTHLLVNAIDDLLMDNLDASQMITYLKDKKQGMFKTIDIIKLITTPQRRIALDTISTDYKITSHTNNINDGTTISFNKFNTDINIKEVKPGFYSVQLLPNKYKMSGF